MSIIFSPAKSNAGGAFLGKKVTPMDNFFIVLEILKEAGAIVSIARFALQLHLLYQDYKRKDGVRKRKKRQGMTP